MFKRKPKNRAEKHKAMEQLPALPAYEPPTIPTDAKLCHSCTAEIQIKIDTSEIVKQLIAGITSDNDIERLKQIGSTGLWNEIKSEFSDNLNQIVEDCRRKAIKDYITRLEQQVYK